MRYARANGFDPLKPHNWYPQTKAKILSVKVIFWNRFEEREIYKDLTILQGASGVLAHHQHSVAKALLDLFPNIGLSKSLLRSSQCMFEGRRGRRTNV